MLESVTDIRREVARDERGALLPCFEQAVVYGILNSDPEPPTAVRTGVPMELEWIIDKLLTKDRQKRYHGADEVIVDLGRIDLGITSATRTTRSFRFLAR